MVIYSACICTKGGKILLARQFVPISKIKIEEHISRLPKHLGSSQQHTQIEIENLRYLYIPMQDLLLVVISNRMSNVIEDMEILKLLYGIVIEKCKKGGVSEQSVLDAAFDLILAFDDVVTLGYRESVSVAQVMEYLEMDSSEEKMFVKQQKMRESEAKEFAKRQLQEIDKKNRLKAKEKKDKSRTEAGERLDSVSPLKDSEPEPKAHYKCGVYQIRFRAEEAAKTKKVGKGMKLQTKAGRKESKTEKASPEGKSALPRFVEEEKQALKTNPLVEAISITIDEKIAAVISKDGDLNKFEVKGEIYLHVNDESKANAEVHLAIGETKGIVIKPHPELNRALWSSQQIVTSNQAESGFPVNVKLEALKYKYSTNNSADLPFTTTVWSSQEQKDSRLNVVTIELEFNPNNPKFTTVDNIKVLIPLGVSKQPQITKMENSQVNYLDKEHTLEWLVEKLDTTHMRASLEMKTASDVNSLFPFDVKIAYPYSILGARVIKVISADTKQPITYSDKTLLSCENFQIVLEL